MSRKRIALSVNPDLHAKIARLAEYQKTTMASVITELLNECEPAIDVILKAYADIEKGIDKQRVLTGMLVDGLEVAANNFRKD